MANRRMISKSISVSEQVNNLSTFASLLFTWMIAHADDFGRMPGSPAKVRALVVPMRDETTVDVASALEEMVRNDLIIWYEVDSNRYIQFKTWERHQAGLHKRTSSTYPEPPDDSDAFPELPGNSRSRELELEENLREPELEEKKDRDIEQPGCFEEVPTSSQKPNESSSSIDFELAQLGKIYETEGFGQLSGMIAEHLKMLLDTFGFEWVGEAMREAVLQNRRRLKYVKGVLENWRAEGGIRRSDYPKGGKSRAGPPKTDRYEDFYALFPDT